MAWFSYSLSFLGHLLRFTTLDTALHDDARVYHKHYYSRESVFLWRASPINCQPLGASLAYLYCSSAREGSSWYSVSEILTPNCLLNFSFWQSQHQTFWAAAGWNGFVQLLWSKGDGFFNTFPFVFFTVFWPEYRIHLINEEDYVIISIVCTIVQKCTAAHKCILPWW